MSALLGGLLVTAVLAAPIFSGNDAGPRTALAGISAANQPNHSGGLSTDSVGERLGLTSAPREPVIRHSDRAHS